MNPPSDDDSEGHLWIGYALFYEMLARKSPSKAKCMWLNGRVREETVISIIAQVESNPILDYEHYM